MTTQVWKRALLSTASAAVLCGPALAQQAENQPTRQRRTIEEVVITATKREESLQDVPISVNALDSRALDEQNINNFTDYLQALPNVTAGGSGPGQNTIYIRGLASTTPNLTVAGVAGLAPNVAFYLDEQPLAQPGRNLDVYAVDLQRVEVLAGPQGTLFGASSQAGTVRLITNKPDLTQFDASAEFGTSFTQDGEMSNRAEGMINVPLLKNKAAIRGVVYVDRQGGYVDNVRGTRSLADNVPGTPGFDSSRPFDGAARFRPAGTVRRNGVPVSANRQGFQAGADLSDVTFEEADNSAIVEENFNDTSYAGFRVAAQYEPIPQLTATVAVARQSIESDGVFFSDPELDDWEIQRFAQDELQDDFTNVAWTLEGRLKGLELIYTGAFTDRDADQRIDYSDYLFIGQYLPYYVCDGSVTYPGDAAPSGTCQEPNLFVNSVSETTVFTHEFRITTPADFKVSGIGLRATAGAFYSDLQLDERNDFTYPGSIDAAPFGAFAPNFPFDTGFRSDPGPFPPGVIFRNDVRRTDEQLGLFGEFSVDVWPEFVTLTFGARYYDVEVDLEGSANSSFFNSGAAVDQQRAGTDISDLYNGDGQFTFRSAPPQPVFTLDDSFEDILAVVGSEATAQQVFNAVRAPDKAETSGFIFKANVSVTPTENTLFYFTYSEGFRPGLLNRPGGAQGPGGFTVPFELDTDEVNNFELGWKVDLFQNSFRINGAAFYVDISDLQTTIFDPSITNLFFSDNAADAEIFGVEGDFSWVPSFVDGLFVNGAFSWLDTEITNVITPTDDVREGDELAFAPTFQGNLRVRYEWDVLQDYRAHVQPIVSYSASSQSDIIRINAAELDSWFQVGLSAGVTADRWRMELFGTNLTNEAAQLTNDFVFDRERVTLARPRTFGVRVGFNY